MDILNKNLNAIALDDIERLCADQAAEGNTLELKADLPSRQGKGGDPWHSGGTFADHARNTIASEVVAFANTLGGVIVLGINETSDKPSRAESINSLPRIHDLARSLRQAIQDIIDPPLPVLETVGVDCDGAGNGVVIIRVPASRRRPHRHNANREVFIRRVDESVRIGMRQIQELTIQALAEGRHIEDVIAARRTAFRERHTSWLKRRQQPEPRRGAGLQFVALPTSPIDLGRVAGRQELVTMPGNFVAKGQGQLYGVSWPFGPTDYLWRPGLRCITTTRELDHVRCEYSLTTDAICELAFYVDTREGHRGFFAAWLTGALGKMLVWIDQVRSQAQAPGVEFALAAQIVVEGAAIGLAPYGAHDFQLSADYAVPIGLAEFPLMSVAGSAEFPEHLRRFDEDIWNLAGKHFPTDSLAFEFGAGG